MNATQIAIAKWYMYGRTGISSKAMAQWLGFGKKNEDRDQPHDPADFNRCLELLRVAPELREQLPKMAKVSKGWKLLVPHWDAVEKSFLAEVGRNWKKGKTAPLTYSLMREILSGKYVPPVPPAPVAKKTAVKPSPAAKAAAKAVAPSAPKAAPQKATPKAAAKPAPKVAPKTSAKAVAPKPAAAKPSAKAISKAAPATTQVAVKPVKPVKRPSSKPQVGATVPASTAKPKATRSKA